jgi:LPS-assembly lipoprotein
MLLYERRKFLLMLGASPMAGCGFQPVYKQSGAARALHGNLYFNLIESREGFALLERLESRLGAGGSAARYAVNVELIFEETEMVLTAATALITFTARNTVKGIAKLSITDRTTGAEVFTDKLRDSVGYSSNEETLASDSSKRDAYDRLVLALADQIVLRLSSTAESWAE